MVHANQDVRRPRKGRREKAPIWALPSINAWRTYEYHWKGDEHGDPGGCRDRYEPWASLGPGDG